MPDTGTAQLHAREGSTERGDRWAGETETGQEVWDPGDRVMMVSDGPLNHTWCTCWEKKMYKIQCCLFLSYSANARKWYQSLINCKITTVFAISASGRFTGEPGTRMGVNSLPSKEGCLVAWWQCCLHGSPRFLVVQMHLKGKRDGWLTHFLK